MRFKLSDSLKKLDDAMINIYSEMIKSSISSMSANTELILEISESYLKKETTSLLKQFYYLYLKKEKDQISQTSEEVNKEVDDIINQLNNNQTVVESMSLKEKRLAISALQKRLEGLITLDNGIKDEILPALTAMQFEDTLRQRLEHLESAWLLANTLYASADEEKVDLVASEILKKVSSVFERDHYYKIVLQQEPPKDNEDLSSGMINLF